MSWSIPETRFAVQDVLDEAAAHVEAHALEPALAGVSGGADGVGAVAVGDLEGEPEGREVQVVGGVREHEADEPRARLGCQMLDPCGKKVAKRRPDT
jgi:hypothetical protein